MGLGVSLSGLLSEHSYKAIEGDFLCLGKQTVTLPQDEILEQFSVYGIDDKRLRDQFAERTYDTSTRNALRYDLKSIEDCRLIGSFSSARYHCLDRSEYEGATVLHDMNQEIPPEMESSYDFIYNGSCMDNVFDPVRFIQNTSRMLRDGGRIVHIEAAGNYPGSYLMFSPEWYYSYYSINDFADCRVYVTLTTKAEDLKKNRVDFFTYSPHFTRNEDYNYHEAVKSIDGIFRVLVIAEKGVDSSWSRAPVQMQYLEKQDVDWRERETEFAATGRPVLRCPHIFDRTEMPYLSDHFRYIGSWLLTGPPI